MQYENIGLDAHNFALIRAAHTASHNVTRRVARRLAWPAPLGRLRGVLEDVAMSSKRLLFLESLVQKGTDDPMAYYGLAMEYRSASRVDDALRVFGELRAKKPDYVAMYLMCGQLLAEAARKDEARTWLEQGIDWAKKTGNSHAASELEAALASL